MGHEVAVRLVGAVAAKDRATFESLLAPEVDFRGLTPGRAWETSSASEVASFFLDHWFGPNDHIREVSRLERGEGVVDVHHVTDRAFP